MKILDAITSRLRFRTDVRPLPRRHGSHAMNLGSSEAQFLQELGAAHRILLIGRAATVCHGGTMAICDYEVWMEPLHTEDAWLRSLQSVVNSFLHTALSAPRSLTPLAPHLAEAALREHGALCVSGFAIPVVIHRRANEFDLGEFDRVWEDASPLLPGIRLPSLIDLFLNKINTGRHSDYEDMIWLEERVRSLFFTRLPCCDAAEAGKLLSRYIDPESLRHALINPHPEVRDMARGHLESFASAGDPYSAEILESCLGLAQEAA